MAFANRYEQDRVLEQMTADDFQVPLHTKVRGTLNLSEEFKTSNLDFFIMLSSLSGIVGSRGQANYAAGNTFQDALANYHEKSETNYLALDLGMIEDTAVYNDMEGQVRVRNLFRQGWVPIKDEELLGLFAYAISPEARKDKYREIVTGIDGRSIHEAENATPATRGAMFAHVRSSYTSKDDPKTYARESWKQAVARAQRLGEARQIITAAISQQLSKIVALDQDKITQESPLLDFGLDSLLAIELKNWISQEFDAPIQASEILDEPSVTALGVKVASRSSLITKRAKEDLEPEVVEGNNYPYYRLLEISQKPNTNEIGHEKLTSPVLPRLPVPDLTGTLELYLTSARAFLSIEQFNNTSDAVQNFQEGIGQQLQARLLDRSHNPQIDNWQYDLHVRSIYLKRRDPIHPYGTFYGGHVLTNMPHGQAERAAVISTAAFEFKQRLDAGEVEQEYMNEEPLCMNSLQWLFNANREPGIGVDSMCQYPGNDYVVAMKRGHIFKIMLAENGKAVPYLTLKAKFQAIIDLPVERQPGVTALTAEERDTWAKLRENLKGLSAANDALIGMVEAAAFVVCLDEESPLTPTQRCNQFLLGDPRNRWSDKSLQFVVCENGVSAYICEHSMLDAASLKQINKFITQALINHEAEVQTQAHVDGHEDTAQPYGFTVNESIESSISRVRTRFKATYTPAEFRHYRLHTLGNNFLHTHKVPSKAGLQLILQLTSLKYFGRQHPSWETITTMPFHKGRLDWMQVVSQPMFAFCRAATDETIPEAQCRRLLREAANTHTTTMTRIARGHGFAAHLEALQEILHDDEPVPALFRDSTWKMMHVTSTRKFKTDASDGLMVQEGGFFMPDPESVWVHYEVEENECLFYVQSTEGRTAAFCEALEWAAEKVKSLLET